MTQYSAVNVSILIGERIVDLRIPRLVSIEHLKKVLVQALGQQLGIPLPNKFQLFIKNKNFGTSKLLMYDEYAIGDGDQIIITEVQV